MTQFFFFERSYLTQIHTVTNDSTDRPPLHACRFAAQVFHGLYDEVMSTSARGHGLMLRVQQLEADLPLLETESCQRDYLYIASNRGGFHTSTSFSFTAHPSPTHSFQKKIRYIFCSPILQSRLLVLWSLLQGLIGIPIQGWSMGL